MDSKLYDIFSKPADYLVGTRPRLSIYRSPGFPRIKKQKDHEMRLHKDMKANFGKLRVEDQPGLTRGTKIGSKYYVDIAYTAIGDIGPLILFLHGVPANRRQYYPIMKLLCPFARCICIDMLGMGDSQVKRTVGDPFKKWLWIHDATYIHNFMRGLFGEERFIFVADDWGGGSLAHYAVKYPSDLLNQIYIDPVALDGYPVAEIQAIGRASPLPDDKFMEVFGAADQTFIQIFKTMVHKPDKVWNQWTYRWILEPYIDVSYEKGFTSTMALKWNPIRNLSDRAFTLGAAQLLPWHPKKNPLGVKYSKMKANCLILWGEKDNMMPESQRHRLRYIIMRATEDKVRVQTRQIRKAGHFAGLDQPDLVSAMILDYLIEQHGSRKFLADIFLGFRETTKWKGDEKEVIECLRKF